MKEVQETEEGSEKERVKEARIKSRESKEDVKRDEEVVGEREERQAVSALEIFLMNEKQAGESDSTRELGSYGHSYSIVCSL